MTWYINIVVVIYHIWYDITYKYSSKNVRKVYYVDYFWHLYKVSIIAKMILTKYQSKTNKFPKWQVVHNKWHDCVAKCETL